MRRSNTKLSNMTGNVACFMSKHKAIILFENDDKEQRALLMYEKIKVNGLDLPVDGNIADYLNVGSDLKFDCNKFSASEEDRCDWLIAVAWYRTKCSSIGGVGMWFEGKCNELGTVVKLSNRHGVLSFKNNGVVEKVLFQASKLFLHCNRVKDNLKFYPELTEGCKLLFDAVPCNDNENNSKCQWFATLVWTGAVKPAVEYDTVGSSLEKFQSTDILAQVRMVALNPRSTFIRGFGQVLQIINQDYGIALLAIKPNIWSSVLFHRSMSFLFGLCLSGQDLTKVFKEGDKLTIIAVPAPKQFIAQLVAINVGVHRAIY